MKKISLLLIPAVLILFYACEKTSLSQISGAANNKIAHKSSAQGAENAKVQGCKTIQSGSIVTSLGVPVKTGYDVWGYNYQAQMFNGTYCNAYQNAAWCQPYAADKLSMKWNDAWLSTQDCDGDNKLDRHHGFPSYRGSGAWLTNHMSGYYPDADGKVWKYEYFVKIVAAPADATLSGGKWYTADGTEIGAEIWGEFAVIQEVVNDPGAGLKGLQYRSPDHAGLNGW
jgi:hypothetical protein